MVNPEVRTFPKLFTDYPLCKRYRPTLISVKVVYANFNRVSSSGKIINSPNDVIPIKILFTLHGFYGSVCLLQI